MPRQITSFSDRLHPIIVRQMRRLVRSHTMTWTTILCLALMSAALCTCILFAQSVRSTNPVDLLWKTASLGVAQLFAYIAAFVPAVMYASAQTNDEMLDFALPPKKILQGYILLGILFSSYFLVLALPFISLSFAFGGPLLLMLLGALSAILTGIVNNLVFLSFLAKIRGFAPIFFMTVFLFFFSQFPFMVIGFIDVIIAMRSMFVGIATAGPGAPPPVLTTPVTTSHPIFLGYTVVMWIVFGLIAYLLCRSHLAHPRRSAWKELAMNVLAYGAFTVVTSLLWAAARYGGLV